MSEIVYVSEPTKYGAAFRPGNFPIRGAGAETAGVLAIDPGLYIGWAYKCGDYITAGFEDLSKCPKLYGTTQEFIELLIKQLSPEYVVVEKYFAAGHALENRTVEQRGAIKAAFERAELPWKEIHVATIRKCLGIVGRPKDAQVRESVSKYFNTPERYFPNPNSNRKKFFRPDVFDALALLMADELILEKK